MSRTVIRPVIVVLGCLLLAGCLPKERLNTSCSWRGDSAFAIDPHSRSQAAHLQLDVTLAEEVGMRYGDQFRRRIPIAQTRRLGDACTDSLFAVIERLHNVRASDVLALRGKRDPLIDFAAIYLPMMVLFTLVSAPIARRVGTSFEQDERWPRIVALGAISLLVAAAGALLAYLWSSTVDGWRLRDGHLSYRTNRIPIGHHPVLTWLTGVVIFLGVAAVCYRSIIAAASNRRLGGRRPPWERSYRGRQATI